MEEAGDGITPQGTPAATTIQTAVGRPQPVAAVALLIIIALAALGFLHTYHQPLDRDITSYAVIGRELLAGRRLYTDIWDNKPPAIHVVFAAAELLAGPGPGAIYLLNVLAAAAGMGGVYMAVRAAGRPAGASLCGAALLGLLTFNVKFQGNMPNTEVWINACLIWMLVLLFRCGAGPMNWPTAIGLGLLAAAATLFKHVAVFPITLVALVDLGVARVSWNTRLARLARWVAAGAIVVLAWSAVGTYFWLRGRFGDFYHAVIAYNASFIEGQRVTWRAVVAPEFMVLVLPTVVPAAWALLLAVVIKAKLFDGGVRVFSLHLAMALGCYAAALAPGKFYPHYFQLLFPTLALSLVWSVGLLVSVCRLRSAWWRDLIALAIILPLGVGVGRAMLLSPREWSLQGYGTDFVETWREAPRIEAMLRPSETFWDLGSETGLYYLTGQRPPVTVFYQPPLFRGPLAPKFAERTLEQLQQRPPDLIVLLARRSMDVGHQASTPLIRWVLAQYREVPRADDASFRHYVRRGCALEGRLMPVPPPPPPGASTRP